MMMMSPWGRCKDDDDIDVTVRVTGTWECCRWSQKPVDRFRGAQKHILCHQTWRRGDLSHSCGGEVSRVSLLAFRIPTWSEVTRVSPLAFTVLTWWEFARVSPIAFTILTWSETARVSPLAFTVLTWWEFARVSPIAFTVLTWSEVARVWIVLLLSEFWPCKRSQE